MATVPMVHRFPDLEKNEAAKRRLLFRITCNFFEEEEAATASEEKERSERGVEEDDDGDEEERRGPYAGLCLVFRTSVHRWFENKHRKDRNCFSEHFDSGQMNLLKYTRNSSSRQYLHGRGGRIYIRAGCIAPFKPPKRLDDAAARGHVDAVFYCCRAAWSGPRRKKSCKLAGKLFCDV